MSDVVHLSAISRRLDKRSAIERERAHEELFVERWSAADAVLANSLQAVVDNKEYPETVEGMQQLFQHAQQLLQKIRRINGV